VNAKSQTVDAPLIDCQLHTPLTIELAHHLPVIFNQRLHSV